MPFAENDGLQTAFCKLNSKCCQWRKQLILSKIAMQPSFPSAEIQKKMSYSKFFLLLPFKEKYFVPDLLFSSLVILLYNSSDHTDIAFGLQYDPIQTFPGGQQLRLQVSVKTLRPALFLKDVKGSAVFVCSACLRWEKKKGLAKRLVKENIIGLSFMEQYRLNVECIVFTVCQQNFAVLL